MASLSIISLGTAKAIFIWFAGIGALIGTIKVLVAALIASS